jgi:hypothetical protein
MCASPSAEKNKRTDGRQVVREILLSYASHSTAVVAESKTTAAVCNRLQLDSRPCAEEQGVKNRDVKITTRKKILGDYLGGDHRVQRT